MPTVAVEIFQTHGKTYYHGDVIPEEIIESMPPFIRKIHMDKRAIKHASSEEAAEMRENRKSLAPTSEKDAQKRKISRTWEKIVELEKRIAEAVGNKASNEAALAKLQAVLYEMLPETKPVAPVDPAKAVAAAIAEIAAVPPPPPMEEEISEPKRSGRRSLSRS